MKTVSVSEAKASFSEQLRHVRRGGEVLITHRGKPVARLVSVLSGKADLEELEALGLARRGTGKLPARFWSSPRPSDPSGSIRAAVVNEREDTW